MDIKNGGVEVLGIVISVPAIEYTHGAKEWWLNGKRHRDDGPAKESPNGANEWWIDGEHVTKEEFEIFRSTQRAK